MVVVLTVFNPADPVAKEQLAFFIIRGMNKDEDGKVTPDVTDDSVSNYAKSHVALALHLFPFFRTDGPINGTMPISRYMLLLALDELTVTYCGCGPPRNQPGSTKAG